MLGNQEHIINKVFVEINTKSEKHALEFKNSVEIFLQDEVFPKIEEHLENLPIVSENEIQKISKITLDVAINSRGVDFSLKSTRSELKEQILKKLDQVLQEPKKHDVAIKKQSITESNADAFFQFLQDGTLAWWNTVATVQEFSDKVLYEITETPSFENRFLKALQNKTEVERLINQFFNTELKILFLGLYHKPKGFLEVLNAMTSITFISSNNKVAFWNQFIGSMMTGALNTFMKYLKHKAQQNSNSNRIEIEVSRQILKKVYAQNKTFIKELFADELEEINNNDEKQIKGTSEENIAALWNSKNLQESFVEEQSKETQDEAVIKSTVLPEKTLKEEPPRIKNDSNNKQENSIAPKKEIDNEFVSNTNIHQETVITHNEERIQKASKKAKEKTTDAQRRNGNKQHNTNQRDLNEEENASNHQTETTKEKVVSRASDTSIKASEGSEKGLSVKEPKVFKGAQAKEKDKITDLQYNKYPKGEDVNPSKSYIVKNAGLVLLHPFLSRFFKSCGLLGKDNQILEPEVAVHVLHYVATKKEQQLESNLIFEKFLCNVPITHSINRNINITDELKEKSEELLKAVVQNWEILKKSSPDLVRNEFLQRAGKLSLTKENPLITIERKTQDILLDKLPWGIGICKLPWMRNFMEIDW